MGKDDGEMVSVSQCCGASAMRLSLTDAAESHCGLTNTTEPL